VRRVILLAMVAAVMAAMIMVGALSVNAQVPGQTEHCESWQTEWGISEGWWWYQYYRWCYNPSIEGGWYIDWDGWGWWGPA
jgi:hypothetical protein